MDCEEENNTLETLVSLVKGYSGYADRTKRLETDELLRGYIADRKLGWVQTRNISEQLFGNSQVHDPTGHQILPKPRSTRSGVSGKSKNHTPVALYTALMIAGASGM